MKTREDAIKVADLLAVAHFEEELVIFIDSEEGISPTSLAVQANFETGEFKAARQLNIEWHRCGDGFVFHQEAQDEGEAMMLQIIQVVIVNRTYRHVCEKRRRIAVDGDCLNGDRLALVEFVHAHMLEIRLHATQTEGAV